MNRNYLNYLLRSKRNLIIFVAISFALIYFSSVAAMNTETFALGAVTVVAFVMSFVLVPVIFSYVFSKKAVDAYFALPISRKEQLVTSQIFIDALILVPTLALDLVSLCLDGPHFTGYLLYIPIIVIAIITTVAFISGLFFQANSLFDGVVIASAYLIVLLFVYISICELSDIYIYGGNFPYIDDVFEYLSIIYSSASALGLCLSLMQGKAIEFIDFIPFFVCIAAHWAIAVWMMKSDFIERKTERAESISSKFTAYPLVIGLYTFFVTFISVCGNAQTDFSGLLFTLFLTFIFFEVGNCVYRRKVKLTLKDVGIFVIGVALSFLICFIAFKTRGFGLADNYIKDPYNIAYRIDENYYRDDLKNDEFLNLIKKKIPDAEGYNVTIQVDISSKDIKNSSEIIEYMESLRKDVIDDYYSDFMNFSGIRRSCLTVFTNIKENKNGSFTQYIYDDAEEYRSYPFGEVRKLTLDDYLYLERFGDVQVLVWGRFETKELSSLSDLLEG